jgi:hypothetical protein
MAVPRYFETEGWPQMNADEHRLNKERVDLRSSAAKKS